MAAGIIRSFLVQAPAPAYFPLIFQRSPRRDGDNEEKLEDKERTDEDDREEEEEEDEEEESEAQEEEDECVGGVFLDVAEQLIRFAELISRDVQRYFGPTSGDRDARDIYSDSDSATTSGRLRYYDDLLRLARAGSPEERENCSASCSDDRGGAAVAKGNGNLGPLAELFDHSGPSRARSRPMIKRHLPLSFWTEPISCRPAVGFGDAHEVTRVDADAPSRDGTHADAHAHYSALSHHSAHCLDGTQPDFSDLLANWDPNPELAHALTESSHMQHEMDRH